MSDNTAIQWAGATWNPVTGCTKVSAGCARCYIASTPPFRMAGRRFVDGKIPVILHEDRLDAEKVRRMSPRDRPIFVCSLADLFHEDVPAAFIGDVFDVMRRCPERTFQVLTKRPERMAEVLAMQPLIQMLPLPNVWLGVSIENSRFTWRADVLREIPAAVRFISAEPLLGSLLDVGREEVDGSGPVGRGADPRVPSSSRRAPLDLDGIDWLIVGGESGPGSRRMNLVWALELVDAGRAAGTAVFVKQLGRVLGQTFGGKKGEDFDAWPEPLQVREYPPTVEKGVQSIPGIIPDLIRNPA